MTEEASDNAGGHAEQVLPEQEQEELGAPAGFSPSGGPCPPSDEPCSSDAPAAKRRASFLGSRQLPPNVHQFCDEQQQRERGRGQSRLRKNPNSKPSKNRHQLNNQGQGAHDIHDKDQCSGLGPCGASSDASDVTIPGPAAYQFEGLGPGHVLGGRGGGSSSDVGSDSLVGGTTGISTPAFTCVRNPFLQQHPETTGTSGTSGKTAAAQGHQDQAGCGRNSGATTRLDNFGLNSKNPPGDPQQTESTTRGLLQRQVDAGTEESASGMVSGMSVDLDQSREERRPKRVERGGSPDADEEEEEDEEGLPPYHDDHGPCSEAVGEQQQTPGCNVGLLQADLGPICCGSDVVESAGATGVVAAHDEQRHTVEGIVVPKSITTHGRGIDSRHAQSTRAAASPPICAVAENPFTGYDSFLFRLPGFNDSPETACYGCHNRRSAGRSCSSSCRTTSGRHAGDRSGVGGAVDSSSCRTTPGRPPVSGRSASGAGPTSFVGGNCPACGMPADTTAASQQQPGATGGGPSPSSLGNIPPAGLFQDLQCGAGACPFPPLMRATGRSSVCTDSAATGTITLVEDLTYEQYFGPSPSDELGVKMADYGIAQTSNTRMGEELFYHLRRTSLSRIADILELSIQSVRKEALNPGRSRKNYEEKYAEQQITQQAAAALEVQPQEAQQAQGGQGHQQGVGDEQDHEAAVVTRRKAELMTFYESLPRVGNRHFLTAEEVMDGPEAAGGRPCTTAGTSTVGPGAASAFSSAPGTSAFCSGVGQGSFPPQEQAAEPGGFHGSFSSFLHHGPGRSGSTKTSPLEKETLRYRSPREIRQFAVNELRGAFFVHLAFREFPSTWVRAIQHTDRYHMSEAMRSLLLTYYEIADLLTTGLVYATEDEEILATLEDEAEEMEETQLEEGMRQLEA
eukprot:GSA25T00007224001.1